MPIEKNQVVLFHYSVRDEQGNEVENSRGGEPSAYLHGHGGIIRGLEEALEVLKGSDVILHAGDVGRDEVLEALEAIAPVVYSADHGRAAGGERRSCGW